MHDEKRLNPSWAQHSIFQVNTVSFPNKPNGGAREHREQSQYNHKESWRPNAIKTSGSKYEPCWKPTLHLGMLVK